MPRHVPHWYGAVAFCNFCATSLAQFGVMLILVQLLSLLTALPPSSHRLLVFSRQPPIQPSPCVLQIQDPESIDWQAHFTAAAAINLLIFGFVLLLAFGLTFTATYRGVALPLAALGLVFLIEIPSTLCHRMLEAHHDWKRFQLLLAIGDVTRARLRPCGRRDGRRRVGAHCTAIDAGFARSSRPVLDEQVLGRKVPLLGICLGAQLLTRGSEEGSEPGRGWVAADTRRFDAARLDPSLRVPHMGWADTEFRASSGLFAGTAAAPRYYYVHSYHIVADDAADELCHAVHGYRFVAGVGAATSRACSSIRRRAIVSVSSYSPTSPRMCGLAQVER